MEEEVMLSIKDTLNKQLEWLGWRISSEISSCDNGSYFNEIKNEISNLNLTLQEINTTLVKIAEKD